MVIEKSIWFPLLVNEGALGLLEEEILSAEPRYKGPAPDATGPVSQSAAPKADEGKSLL